MQATQTALIVVVPEAEPAVGELRSTLDRAASWGVPAHVTILYPFLPPAEITPEVLATVGEVIAGQAAFDVAFEQVRWFDERVVWLAPTPERPFLDLTHALWQRFPQAPPYGGAHDDLIAHLTVGHDAPLDVLRDAADTVATRLPVQARIGSVRLIAGNPEPGDSWHTVAEFPLG